MSSASALHPQTVVVLCNLGTPDAPTPRAVRRYLREFLSDRHVVDLPPLLWRPILYGLILPFRARTSADKYKSIWMPEGSPLQVWSRKQARLLHGWFGEEGHYIPVVHAMRYGSPSIHGTLNRLLKKGVGHILVVPAYPQYATSTTTSLIDCVQQWKQKVAARKKTSELPHIDIVEDYATHPAYIRALREHTRYQWMTQGRGERLLMSFHGIPARSVSKGDPYPTECQETAQHLADKLGLQQEQWLLSYQSQFGRARWLEPKTVDVLRQWAQQGVRSVDVICPGFTADCLETLEEINIEARNIFLEAGGETFNYIPCLNDHPKWTEALGKICIEHLTRSYMGRYASGSQTILGHVDANEEYGISD